MGAAVPAGALRSPAETLLSLKDQNVRSTRIRPVQLFGLMLALH
jgi:hypothetical protein